MYKSKVEVIEHEADIGSDASFSSLITNKRVTGARWAEVATCAMYGQEARRAKELLENKLRSGS